MGGYHEARVGNAICRGDTRTGLDLSSGLPAWTVLPKGKALSLHACACRILIPCTWSRQGCCLDVPAYNPGL